MLHELQQGHWAPRFGAELAVGGPEIQFAIAVREGAPAVEQVERGSAEVLGRFSDRASAYRYLILILAEDLRSRRRWPRIEHRGTAPDTQLGDGDQLKRLTWPEGWAEFPSGDVGVIRACPFSWVARVEPEQIVDSYGQLNGQPLFDLGITDPRPWTDPTPRSTLKPRPAETPPADPAGATETELVLAAVADIGWIRQPVEENDVLAVSDRYSGRVISSWHEMFWYQTLTDDHRSTRATFSTAAAARRFLVMETGSIARTRRRQSILGVRGPAAGFTVSKGPTEFVVEGSEMRATFPLGPIGQQHALTFTWCAPADLTEIVASYRDPDGAPLFPPPASR